MIELKLNRFGYRRLSGKFINDFQDDLDWEYVSTCQDLSEDFIRKFQNKVVWNLIGIYQELSEDFIREFQDRVDWRCVSIFQNLSKEFCLEFYDKIHWNVNNKLYKGYFDNVPKHVKLYIALNYRELSRYL